MQQQKNRQVILISRDDKKVKQNRECHNTIINHKRYFRCLFSLSDLTKLSESVFVETHESKLS